MAVTACRDREFKNAWSLDELIATELLPICCWCWEQKPFDLGRRAHFLPSVLPLHCYDDLSLLAPIRRYEKAGSLTFIVFPTVRLRMPLNWQNKNDEPCCWWWRGWWIDPVRRDAVRKKASHITSFNVNLDISLAYLHAAHTKFDKNLYGVSSINHPLRNGLHNYKSCACSSSWESWG